MACMLCDAFEKFSVFGILHVFDFFKQHVNRQLKHT